MASGRTLMDEVDKRNKRLESGLAFDKAKTPLEPDYKLFPIPKSAWDDLNPLKKAALCYLEEHTEGFWDGPAMQHVVGEIVRVAYRLGLSHGGRMETEDSYDR
jgi:hypothetical protein